MSVVEYFAKHAMHGPLRLTNEDSPQISLHGLIGDTDDVVRDHIHLHAWLSNVQSIVFYRVLQCKDAEQIQSVLHGSSPNVLVIGQMDEYDRIQSLMKQLLSGLPSVAILFVILVNLVQSVPCCQCHQKVRGAAYALYSCLYGR